MKIMDRYIARQVFLNTFYSVLVLSMIIMLGNVFQKIRYFLVEQNAPLIVVGKFIINTLPPSLMFTIPWGFLSAVLLVMERMSKGQEINAFRVAGKSLTRIAMPIFVMGFCLSLMCLYININIVPKAKSSLMDLIYEQLQRDPGSLLRPGLVQSSLADKKVFIEKREGDVLKGFHFFQTNHDPNQPNSSYVYAEQAEFVVNQEKQQFFLKLTNATIQKSKSDGTLNTVITAKAEPLIFDFPAQKKRLLKANNMSNGEIRKLLENQESLSKKEVSKYKTELMKRFSFSMACFVFAFVAVPLGIQSRRKESMNGWVLSLGIALVYFLFSMLAKEFNSVILAYVFLWLPNILCLGVGCYLFRKAAYQ